MSYRTLILSEPSLVSFVPCNETTGPNQDIVVGDYGVVGSAPPAYGVPIPASLGSFGTTLNSGGRLNWNNPLYGASATDFSAEAWFNSTSPDIGKAALPQFPGASLVNGDIFGAANDWAIAIVGNSQPLWEVGNPDFTEITGPGNYSDGVWHHVVGTYAHATGVLQLYIDGVLIGTATAPSPGNKNGNITFTSGQYALSWVGTICNLAIYNSVLSSSKVREHYAQGTGVIETVPDLFGLTPAAAATALAAVNLVVGTQTNTFTIAYISGTVFHQSPAAGSLLSPGDSVDIEIAIGGTPVPNLLGGNQAEAISILTAAGLTLGSVSTQNNPNIAVGTIFAQDPAPGTYVVFGSAVSITISLGATAVVPDLYGMTLAVAESTLAQFKLSTGTVGAAYDGFTTLGDVVTQNPAAGTRVKLPFAVDVDLSILVPFFDDSDITVISQYQNSSRIKALVADFEQYFDPTANITNFYNVVWNIDTAVGFGQDIWGRILGVSRVIPNPSLQGYFGFENTNRPFDWQNWGNLAGTSGGPFFSGQNSDNSFKLNDPSYRTLLLTKALANICATTAPALNALVSNLFPGRGICYTQDLGAMEMEYVFNFALTNIEFAILSYSGVLPHPAGVGVSITVNP